MTNKQIPNALAKVIAEKVWKSSWTYGWVATPERVGATLKSLRNLMGEDISALVADQVISGIKADRCADTISVRNYEDAVRPYLREQKDSENPQLEEYLSVLMSTGESPENDFSVRNELDKLNRQHA